MPDDKPDFTAAQSKHAQDIKMRRTLSRVTGLTPNEVRNGLRQIEQVAGPAVARNPNAPVPLSQGFPPLADGAMGFSPGAFQNGDGGQGAAPAMPSTTAGTSSNPYPLGTNSVGPSSGLLDDTWDLTGPTPSGGGPWDGVTNWYERPYDTTTVYSGLIDGKTVTVERTNLAVRLPTFDSNGALVALTAEFFNGTKDKITIV